MVTIDPGTQIGKDGERYPIAEVGSATRKKFGTWAIYGDPQPGDVVMFTEDGIAEWTAPEEGGGGGGIGSGVSSWDIVERNAAGTSVAGEFTWADTSAAGWELEIPLPVADTFVGIKLDVGGHPLTIVADGGALIEGQASITLEEEGASITLGANGTKWGIL